MKYRLIKSTDNIMVITEDGGIADIHESEPYEGVKRLSTTEYYQTRFTEDDLLSAEPVWAIVGEGKMYYNDWPTEFDDHKHVVDALNWLSPDDTFELDETIWPNFKG